MSAEILNYVDQVGRMMKKVIELTGILEFTLINNKEPGRNNLIRTLFLLLKTLF